jgi:hypothetical protein
VNRLVCFILGLLLAASGASAEPYWYAYEGNDFPENEGWQRWASHPAPERWLEDGNLFVDSRGIVGSVDNYTIYFDEGLDPEPGETFVMSWRLNVHEATPNREDPGVYVISDDLWTVTFLFDEDSLESLYEPDMRNYELYIDGDLAIEGAFFEGFFSPYVGFGDLTSGTSLAAWDYFRFGVVPEPATIGLFLAALLACASRAARRMHRVVLLPVLACILAASATAEPYWIAYEGNDFPENEGWERYVTDPPAVRWLEDGSFYMDTRADPQTTDSYASSYDGGFDPGPGETFVLRWGLTVMDSQRLGSSVEFTSDDLWAVHFDFDEDTLVSLYEPTVYVDIEPHVHHEYELRTSDVRNYQLYVDGDLAVEGVFFESFFPSGVGFGDLIRGGGSLSAWDYFRFGVVPEPGTSPMIAITLPLFRTRSWSSKAQRANLSNQRHSTNRG